MRLSANSLPDGSARRWRRSRCSLFATTLLFTAKAALSFAVEHPDVQTIVARSVEANKVDWAAYPRYDFTEVDRTPTGTVTYKVRMILGTPYYYRAMENGKPLPADRIQEERQKLEDAIAKRRAESPQEKAERIAKFQKDRTRDHMLMSQLTAAFDFKFVREQSMGPCDVWELKATPRAGYRPSDMETEALTGMDGSLWIDTKTFQWVKVEAHVVRPVTIEGFLARVEPGTYFELEKAPVADGIWLRDHFAMRSRAKVLYLFNRRSRVDETYTYYHLSDPSLQSQPTVSTPSRPRSMTRGPLAQ